QEGELVVKDGWDRAREGVALSSFGPSWTAEKLGRKLGEYQPVPTDIFSQVGAPGRYDPEAINVDIRPEKVAETESLKQYACRHFAERLPKMARNGELKSCLAVHRTLAEAGLWMGIQHGHLVLHDGFEPQQTPVRADSIWPLLTLENIRKLNGGWQSVPKDIFTQVVPQSRFSGHRMDMHPVSDHEWHRMRTGAGPQGAIKREIFSDKESLWGYAVSHCARDIQYMISEGRFSWQNCHELFARSGLMLQKLHHGLVIVDAFNHDQTPVKASSIHPDLTLSRAEPQAGPFEIAAADIFDRVKPESRYNPDMAVSDSKEPGFKRDPELRRRRRETRAAAREDLRARYLAWKEHWRKPDLRYGERLREVHAACRRRKAHIRVQFRDPQVRKLHYHIAEVQRMQALIRLKESVREERLSLMAEGKWYPLSYRQWVEQMAVQGDSAAVSQLRGWNYRDRRNDEVLLTTPQRCVVLCEPGSTPIHRDIGGMVATLQRNGSVRFRDATTGEYVCTDYGDRVVFSNSADNKTLKKRMVRVSSVLFARDPRMGFEPEGQDAQFNRMFADMVAWKNVQRDERKGHYRISRSDVDQLRVSSEKRFRDYLKGRDTESHTYHHATDENKWEPPSPGM
ncbi:TPA: relaxase NikB, partial [Escherichia coli]